MKRGYTKIRRYQLGLPVWRGAVAEEVARKAYWNSSFFGGTYQDLAALASR